jgi:hypothetical protein
MFEQAGCHNLMEFKYLRATHLAAWDKLQASYRLTVFEISRAKMNSAIRP